MNHLPDPAEMTEPEWRRHIAALIDDLVLCIRGVDGDDNLRGLVGTVREHESKIRYIEITTIEKTVMPRIRQLETMDREQTAWRRGVTWALAVIGTLVSVIGVVLIFGG